jgi:hypothetical protein
MLFFEGIQWKTLSNAVEPTDALAPGSESSKSCKLDSLKFRLSLLMVFLVFWVDEEAWCTQTDEAKVRADS